MPPSRSASAPGASSATAEEGQGRPKIVWPQGADKARATAMIEAISLARDLITTPSSDMGPAELRGRAGGVGQEAQGEVRVIVAMICLKQNYPMVHAVGRASTRAPRLIDLVWGRAAIPK
jgi:leucyl aminopeptidase